MLRVSRPRFWLYLGGTYLVGYTVGAESLDLLLDWRFWAHLLYFLLPANLFLYGLNDLADADTDQFNPKKRGLEQTLTADDRPALYRGVVFAGLISLVALGFQASLTDAALLVLFGILCVAYSMPPLRLKARPVVDSASNVLYALPGFLGYHQASGRLVSWQIVAAAWMWTAAMHLFSAIPDIESDRKAGLETTAVKAGHTISLWICAALWLGFAITASEAVAYRPFVYAAFLYPAIPLILAFMPRGATYRTYWWFPKINSLFGMGFFFLAALRK